MANMCAHFLSGACSILGATRDQARQCARVRPGQKIIQRMPQSIEQGPDPSGCRRQRRRWQPKKARRREAARPRPQQSNGDGMEQSARRHERSAPRQRLTATAAPIATYAERLLRVAAAFMVRRGGRRDLLARRFVGSPLPPFFHLASLVLLPPPSFSGLRPVSPVHTKKLPSKRPLFKPPTQLRVKETRRCTGHIPLFSRYLPLTSTEQFRYSCARIVVLKTEVVVGTVNRSSP